MACKLWFRLYWQRERSTDQGEKIGRMDSEGAVVSVGEQLKRCVDNAVYLVVAIKCTSAQYIQVVYRNARGLVTFCTTSLASAVAATTAAALALPVPAPILS